MPSTEDNPTPEPLRVRGVVHTRTGFLQGDGPRPGLAKIDLDLRHRLHDRREWFVARRTWNADHHADALTTAQASANGFECKVVEINYSYGAGWGLTRFAHEMAKLGKAIDLAVLIDPVPRYWLPAKWMSLTRLGTYTVPRNVRKVALFRQVNHGPVGREVKLHAHTELVYHEVLGTEANLARFAGDRNPINTETVTHPRYDHLSIDDDPAIRSWVVNTVLQELNS